MKKLFSIPVTLLLFVTLLLSAFVGCSGAGKKQDVTRSTTSQKDTSTTVPKVKPVKLTFMLWGDKPIGMEDVLSEFEKRTADTLNTKLEIIWTPMGEFFNKVKLKLAAKEEMDSVFDAPWANMIQFINQGLYQKLDKYFLDDSFPGLKEAFAVQYVNNNKFNGSVYGIPFATGYKEIYGYYIRKDLREKYGMAKISNINELEIVLKNEDGMIPLADDGNALRWTYGLNDEIDYVQTKDNMFTFTLTGGLSAYCKFSDDLKKCIGVEFGGDRLIQSSNIPYDIVKISSRWKKSGYFERDLLTQQNAVGLFKGGKAAAVAHGLSQFANLENQLKKLVPQAEVEFFVASDSQRVLLPGAMNTDYKAFNFACIPISSKNTDVTMKFYDWLFEDKANHDLFELGIEGRDWIANGDKLFKYLDSGPTYIFPGYELTWNPTMVRRMAGMDNEVYKLYDYEMDMSSYYQTPLAGFTFNSDPVKLEIIKVQNIMDEIGQLYGSGIYEDTMKRAYELNQKARKLGLDKIREEAMKQINNYLKSKQ